MIECFCPRLYAGAAIAQRLPVIEDDGPCVVRAQSSIEVSRPSRVVMVAIGWLLERALNGKPWMSSELPRLSRRMALLPSAFGSTSDR